MTTLQSIHARLLTVWASLVEDNERGDVPGWVLITMMTAGIVTALWALAGPMLNNMFQSAMNGVTGP
ncbi:hypothetical protein SAMN05445756_1696 [Kytococcus aerolatus]|uniref:Uncharacterized protein n=1 Tax=Kytococcus aerolatus TaxID=592308 RepID=A0A212U1A3_9MICO|nr:hypothetical protein [Kytococcus aerolatus]SNC72022.1 hypothetical protein SAMN05445756_1696 [Kytococcus aerolatus]